MSALFNLLWQLTLTSISGCFFKLYNKIKGDQCVSAFMYVDTVFKSIDPYPYRCADFDDMLVCQIRNSSTNIYRIDCITLTCGNTIINLHPSPMFDCEANGHITPHTRIDPFDKSIFILLSEHQLRFINEIGDEICRFDILSDFIYSRCSKKNIKSMSGYITWNHTIIPTKMDISKLRKSLLDGYDKYWGQYVGLFE